LELISASICPTPGKIVAGAVVLCFLIEPEMILNIESTKRGREKISFRCISGLSLAAALGLVGCSRAPEYSIFGSFFPVWIFCSVGGLVLAAGARVAIARTAVAEHLAAPVLFYLSVAIFLACILWLLFYS
jgi:hypothetical protein